MLPERSQLADDRVLPARAGGDGIRDEAGRIVPAGHHPDGATSFVLATAFTGFTPSVGTDSERPQGAASGHAAVRRPRFELLDFLVVGSRRAYPRNCPELLCRASPAADVRNPRGVRDCALVAQRPAASPIHNRPWRARSVADFWGNRWNLWFSDWTRYAIFQPLGSRPVFALILAFAVSGLLHEWVINVPLYFVTGRALFGTMMLYFLLQGAGILVERHFKRHSTSTVAFAWLVVFAPLPLVINEGLLRTLHLWPGLI